MRRLFLRTVLAIVLVMCLAGRAEAHPLGNFTVNQFSRIAVGREDVRIHYVIDMAEIPALQTIQQIDVNGDRQVGADEELTYLDTQIRELPQGLALLLDGKALPLQVEGRSLSFPEGQGGLQTLRLTLDLRASRPAGNGQVLLRFQNSNFSERLGWREIVAVADPGVELRETTALSQTASNELRSYPVDSLSSPLDMREITATAAPGAGGSQGAGSSLPVGQISPQANDQLAALIASRELTPASIAIALLLALLLGAGHALTPGHGKTVVAAYLVGARGTPKHAIFLGLTTTVTHTAGVFLLGLVTLAISQYILPEQLYPWLELISGVMVVVIGVTLLRSRLALLRPNRSDQDHAHGGWLDVGHVHGPDTHTHDYEEKLADWAAGKPSVPARPSPSVSWKSLLALGVSGGLIPCPSALIVLLGAIALGRIAFGMLLILAFSIGLAAVLTGLGLLLVYARRFFEHMPTNGIVMRVVPVASAALVTLAGCAIVVGGLVQAGVVAF
jgi:nickel/cobalt transporter (NicO) family protein